MRATHALGLAPGALDGPLPELSPQALEAGRCWRFCAGWFPERWPVYAALHAVADWSALVELMQTIRDRHEHHDAQQQQRMMMEQRT